MGMLVWSLFLLLLLSLQTSWFAFFPGSTSAPDFLLLFVVFQAMYGGKKHGAFWGLAVGLIQDSLTPGTFGFHVFTRSLAGFVIGAAKERVFKDNIQGYLVFLTAAVLFARTAHLVLLLIIAQSPGVWLGGYLADALRYWLGNLLAGLLLWPVLRKIYNYLEKREKY